MAMNHGLITGTDFSGSAVKFDDDVWSGIALPMWLVVVIAALTWKQTAGAIEHNACTCLELQRTRT